MMDTEGSWVRARELFLELVDADEAYRVAALERLEREEPQIFEAVRKLLEHDQGTAPGTRPEPRLPQDVQVGPYELIDVIGEGGFGTVYRARQERPIVREVAVKILKVGLESPQMLARFEDERRFLARIDHPDVVKILDAGTAPDGRLYVAMELVRGAPITTFAREEGLGLEERVALMMRVGRAVHQVHQRAVIHRDLKPSNILVTKIDGEACPRIIDFGIATAVAESERSGWTRIQGPVCTPGYASPEQLAGSDGIDIRTDVYALGAVLCQLLTGELPREGVTPTETPARVPSAA